MVVERQKDGKQEMAELLCMVCAHEVTEVRVHGVPMAHAQGVFWKLKNTSDPWGFSNFWPKLMHWRVGKGGKV